jgi:hypothetical protein
MMKGHCSLDFINTIAFCMDKESEGRPWDFHTNISLSEDSNFMKSNDSKRQMSIQSATAALRMSSGDLVRYVENPAARIICVGSVAIAFFNSLV